MNVISSVTVTYNPEIDCLERQLQSLKGQCEFSIIVDNGSANFSEIEILTQKYGLVLLRLAKNMGLSYAQNLGVNKAIDSGANYLLLLDQDSILSHNFTKKMLLIYEKNKLGILGPSFYDPATNEHYPGTNYQGPFIKREKIEKVTDVTFIIASGSFFSSEVFKNIGPMEEKLFVDYIDVEWSLRAKKMGYRVAMTNVADMAHTIGDSRLNIFGRKISVHSPLRRYFLVRNSFFMIRLPYIPVGYKIREVIFNILRSIISLILSKNKLKTLKMIFWGLYDGIKGRFGPYTHG